jgi:exosortase/archaeosortase family protein
MFKIKIPEKFKPYQGVFLFVLILLLSNYFWKFTVKGDESDEIVTFLGNDISAPFNVMATHVADVSAFLLDLSGYEVTVDEYNIIRHDNDLGIRIVWACTGFKQAFIFMMIMMLYPGPWLKKIWFIPAGLLIVYLYNIFRIVFILAVIKYNPIRFDLLHELIFKYIFYGIIFLMWVLWEELVRHPGMKKTA